MQLIKQVADVSRGSLGVGFAAGVFDRGDGEGGRGSGGAFPASR